MTLDTLCVLSESDIKCEDFGVFYCRVCQKYYCPEHKCNHLPSFDISFSNLPDIDKDTDENNLYQETEVSFDTETAILSLPTPALRKRIDSLFRELKTLQRELDQRIIHSSIPDNYSKSNSNSRYSRIPSSNRRDSSIPRSTKKQIKLEALLKELSNKGILNQVLNLVKKKG